MDREDILFLMDFLNENYLVQRFELLARKGQPPMIGWHLLEQGSRTFKLADFVEMQKKGAREGLFWNFLRPRFVPFTDTHPKFIITMEVSWERLPLHPKHYEVRIQGNESTWPAEKIQRLFALGGLVSFSTYEEYILNFWGESCVPDLGA